jgi:hypothetical protein
MKKFRFWLACFFTLALLAGGNSWARGNDLIFTFDSEEQPWTSSELEILDQWTSDIYPLAKEVYGPPAFSEVLNVRKNSSIGIPMYWFSEAGNEIILPGADEEFVGGFAHELLHAFRHKFIIPNLAFEEGMVRAAEVAVMNRLPEYAYTNRHHSGGIDVFYELNNQPSIAAKGGNFHAGFNPLLRYQQAGYAWGKCLVEDPAFLRKFNLKYLRFAKRGKGSLSDIGFLSGLARSVKSKVEGLPFDDWFSRQEIFNFSPDTGYQVFFKRDSQNFYLFLRKEDGKEVPVAGASFRWTAFDFHGFRLGGGTGLTNSNGWSSLQFDFPGDLTATRHVLTVALPDGSELVREFCSSNANLNQRVGLFGAVAGKDGGTVKIFSSKREGFFDEVPVVNGAFVSLSAGDFAGKLTVVYQEGGIVLEKTVTKDAGPYFVLFRPERPPTGGRLPR